MRADVGPFCRSEAFLVRFSLSHRHGLYIGFGTEDEGPARRRLPKKETNENEIDEIVLPENQDESDDDKSSTRDSCIVRSESDSLGKSLSDLNGLDGV
ncbi:hypothetical protein C1H46_001752 [Malus baccata]|uniref:Uncharacterized protein n=1 Tax=Malus baccata TaxID=106549 RepID=A0A540NPU6_MALBA|nr:hypothetical protein C1H46_001752 [Malus baccata]